MRGMVPASEPEVRCQEVFNPCARDRRKAFRQYTLEKLQNVQGDGFYQQPMWPVPIEDWPSNRLNDQPSTAKGAFFFKLRIRCASLVRKMATGGSVLHSWLHLDPLFRGGGPRLRPRHCAPCTSFLSPSVRLASGLTAGKWLSVRKSHTNTQDRVRPLPWGKCEASGKNKGLFLKTEIPEQRVRFHVGTHTAVTKQLLKERIDPGRSLPDSWPAARDRSLSARAFLRGCEKEKRGEVSRAFIFERGRRASYEGHSRAENGQEEKPAVHEDEKPGKLRPKFPMARVSKEFCGNRDGIIPA